MLARVPSSLLRGIDAMSCEIEVDLDETDLDRTTIVGLPDAAVKESLERVRAALTNSGYAFPSGRLLVNLAPADVRKEGPVYDLPIALGLLMASGMLRPTRDEGIDPGTFIIAGELALDGRVRPIRGGIALASLAKQHGMRGVILPAANANEAAVVRGVDIVGVATLTQAIGIISGHLPCEPTPEPDIEAMLDHASPAIDFAEVRGQEAVKRAIVVAAAGGHNLLMLGPAGTGKTMMAKALPGVLAPLTPTEAIEVTRIYSAAGQLPEGVGLITRRPVRSPHHTASTAAIVGGGIIPKPGEISLAHHGVLFLDELPEFSRSVLESLRQPLEDHVVTIARAQATLCFPADLMLVAAMNPTPRGDVAPGAVGQREMDRYMSRISGPLLDRIDLHVEAPAVPVEKLQESPRGSSTAQMRDQTHRARKRMIERQGEGLINARLSGKQLDELAMMEDSAMGLLAQAMRELGLSARAYDKIRRMARTIADLTDEDTITPAHIGEAVQYRLLDRRM